jgi:hypothetical protein
MSLESTVIVVSGLPRSGTSLMMQMLDRGGVATMTDELRTADTDNPRGYFEYERVKQIKHDRDWLPEARGKAVKMVSQLLYDLPGDEQYRIIFMRRELDEVLDSQEKMLRRLGRPGIAREQIRAAFELHLQRLLAWLPTQRNMRVLTVSYNQLIAQPDEHAGRIAEFLEGRPDIQGMLAAIDPSLYRNRNAAE